MRGSIPLSYEMLGREKRRKILAPGFYLPCSEGSVTICVHAKRILSSSHYYWAPCRHFASRGFMRTGPKTCISSSVSGFEHSAWTKPRTQNVFYEWKWKQMLGALDMVLGPQRFQYRAAVFIWGGPLWTLAVFEDILGCCSYGCLCVRARVLTATGIW